MKQNMICVARIVSAHGIRGQVKIKIFTTSPDTFMSYKALMNGDGQPLTLTHHRIVDPQHMVVSVDGVRDRNAAELLRGKDLYITRDQLPDVDDDEFYHADLIGLAVQTTTGQSLGVVQGVHNFGAGDVIEVLGQGLPPLMVPFTKAAVPTVSLADHLLVVDDALYRELIKEESKA